MKIVMVLLLALMPLLAGATAPESFSGNSGVVHALHMTSLKEARYRNTIHQKYDFSCGSAAVATLLTYQYGYPVTEQQAFAQMYALGDQAKIRKEGFSMLDIKRFLQANGFDADGFDVPLDKLSQEHLPAIVLVDQHGYHHFVVIKGLRDDRVLVGDPAMGTRVMSRTQFNAVWKDHLVFVIHNRRLLAVFNSSADWRITPSAPLGLGIDRSGLGNLVMPKLGPGDI